MPGVITFTPDLIRYNNSGRFGSVVQISSVLLKRIEAINNVLDHPKKDKLDCSVSLRHKTIGYRISDPNILTVDVEGRVEIVPGGENKEGKKELLASVVAVYELKYVLPKDPMPKEFKGLIKDFADINGIYNAWPYFRARIQDLTSDMGIPFTLPTFRIIPKKLPGGIKEVQTPKLKEAEQAQK